MLITYLFKVNLFIENKILI